MKSLTDNLKRCPVCDKEPYLNSFPYLAPTKPTRYCVECPKCRSSGGIRLTPEEAIESWNSLVDAHNGIFKKEKKDERNL